MYASVYGEHHAANFIYIYVAIFLCYDILTFISLVSVGVNLTD